MIHVGLWYRQYQYGIATLSSFSSSFSLWGGRQPILLLKFFTVVGDKNGKNSSVEETKISIGSQN